MNIQLSMTMGIALLLAANSFAAAEEKPIKVCLVSGSVEYNSDASLSGLQRYWEKNTPIRCTRAFRKTDTDLPGLENLDSCDVMVLFTRRLLIEAEQLDRVKKYCLSGKPIIGIRTASHAFQKWLDFDKEVLGGNYRNHYPAGPMTEVAITESGMKHPILAGVKSFKSEGSLYLNTGLARDNHVILTGSIPGHVEPIAWTRTYKGGRVFYTSLGHPKDFENDNFVRMITKAVYWTTRREPPSQ
jgi:type 1 glutamine amidotransferase